MIRASLSTYLITQQTIMADAISKFNAPKYFSSYQNKICQNKYLLKPRK